MDPIDVLPDAPIASSGDMAAQFRQRGMNTFLEACRYVHNLPYGYNSDRDSPLTLFDENKGSCTTKHAVIVLLAKETGLQVEKQVGIYPMTEVLVTGTGSILDAFALPYLPMIHCYLIYGTHRVDLTEGNHNGKNGPVDDFLFTATVPGNISAKEEYRLYRRALSEDILARSEFEGIDIKTVLHAREAGLTLLKGHLNQ